MPLKDKILFISHNASRTGAPIVLLNHLEELKSQFPSIAFDILLREGGELNEAFEAIAPTSLFSSYSKEKSIYSRLKRKLFKTNRHFASTVKRIIKDKYTIIYSNTIVNADILVEAKKLNHAITTVCHIHELDIAIKMFYGREKLLSAIPYIDYFIAASRSVKEVLVNNYSIPESIIQIHYEYIRIFDKAEFKVNQSIIDKGSSTGLSICGSGTLDWRKGVDVFIRAAYNLNKAMPLADFHFYWIGGHKNSIEYEWANYEILKSDIGHRITIVENTPNPLSYMRLCDLFFLSSREDPFPLVCLEAATLGKPIVCFNGSGGMVEFVDADNGWVIDYLDMQQINDLLVGIVSDENGREILKRKGYKGKLKAIEFDINKGIVKFKALLDGFMERQ